MKKSNIFIFLLSLLSSFAILSLFVFSKDKIELQKVSMKEAISFLSQDKRKIDLPVTNPILSDFQVENIQEGDFIQYDEKNLYIVDYEKLTIFDLATKEIIKQIEFEKFVPSEILLTQDLIILIGIQDVEYPLEIVPGRTFPYLESESKIYMINKQDYSIARVLSFDESFYLTSNLIGNQLYLILANYTIFNPETKTFIYPKYYDSIFDVKQLSPNDLYLSEAGENNYSMRLIVKLSLDEKKPLDMIGILGVEGICKISEDKILLSSFLYDKGSKTAIHVFSIENLKYEGYVLLKGYLINKYAFDVYQGYLRVATNNVYKDQTTNTLYNVSLKNYKIQSQKEIAPQESIYSILFDGNYCYLSTFLYVDPLFIFDFSNPNNIQEIKQNKVEFCCDYLKLMDKNLITLGTTYDENLCPKGLVLAVFDKDSLALKDSYTFKGNDIYSEVKYNEKALTIYQQDILFPMMDTSFQSIQIFHINDAIQKKAEISFKEDYILRVIIFKNELIAISSSELYIYSMNQYEFIDEIVYNTNV